MDAGGCVGAGASGSANVSTSAAAADVNEEPTFELVTNIGRLAVIRNGGECVQQWRSGHNGLTVLQALPLKLIGFILGVLLSIGFTLVGLKFGLLIGLVLGALNIVPYLGTIIGLATVVPLAFFQPGGGWQLLGLVLLVKTLVQLIESWVITPKVMGERTGLHPVTIIVAIFFWGTAFGGVLGMLLAIPLTAFFVTAWRLAKQKYFAAPHV